MRLRALVVDDDRAILEVLTMRLEAMDLEVTAAGDAAAARAAAEAGRFDVALVDLRLGPADGVELMETLRARQARLPVLIMTAHGTIETAVEAVRRGAFDYLTKPFAPEELRVKIGRALARRRWTRDRERLLTLGQTLASTGVVTRVLDGVAQAAVDATEAERCIVFQRERDRLVPRARAGTPPEALGALEAAAAAAMAAGGPVTQATGEGSTIVAAPLVVEQGPAGALVIETSARVAPGEDELALLALFSSQAAVAIRNTHELERLRSGALAALGRMATEVAHELRNPLAGLRLYARHLEQRLTRHGAAADAELAGKIAATVDHLGAVVSGITAFGRPPDLQRAPVDLHALVDECLDLAEARHPGEGIAVLRAFDPACPVLSADARELRKALLNLLVNAREALTTGGRLTVATAWAPARRTVTLTVEDTGIGMSDETLARVFDLFFTTKVDGAGLGMALARTVVERHGGELAVESRPSEGTRVTVRLPLDTGEGRG